ncbi:uncharacterized protein N0V89_003165 [Didymosphaeria variabile]|uniref:Uncharacterized protein n=1 Tax=Didymosphaeria variabile TaxID=1932322 RepID=A0A9W9CEB0_9PLEO|nr:uncharacterized protein N0V89_003165 [Didymosphaeria variabile]KAJ4358581.1 hypothetical protein N0V89_003165 [Didymosphaeria variabile]
MPGFTADEIATATKKVARVFHKESQGLYLLGLRHPAIGLAKLVRHLKRLFKQCAEDLKNEAKDQTEHLGARLVSHQAKVLAEIVVLRSGESLPVPLRAGDVKGKSASTDNAKQESPNDEELIEVFGETVFADFLAFIDFLKKSEALGKFHERLERFVLSARNQGPETGFRAGDPRRPDDQLVHMSAKGSAPEPLLVDIKEGGFDRIFTGNHERIEYVLKLLHDDETLSQLQKTQGILESSPQPFRTLAVVRKVQLRWKCVSGPK